MRPREFEGGHPCQPTSAGAREVTDDMLNTLRDMTGPVSFHMCTFGLRPSRGCSLVWDAGLSGRPPNLDCIEIRGART